MTYQETIDYLYSQLPVYQQVGGSAYKEGLDNSLALDNYFSHPHTQYKTIHVAGTNGKGSTSHLLASILQCAGYKVGLYTSPHLVDFKERIRVNGQKIEEQYIIDFVATHRQAFEPIEPSFFELTMMMAFQYFADEEVDIAIIEVGLGGRLDSTNIITPDLSVITNISFDHIQFLGNTLEKIAAEKAGIIKANVPVVIGEADVVRQVFEDVANRVGAPICFAEDENIVLSSKREKGKLFLETEKYPQLEDGLIGDVQIKNAATVLSAINQLQAIGYSIPKDSVYNGFKKVCELTGLMGRWQTIQENPTIVCDTAHNVGGMQYVVDQLANEDYNKLHIILGMVNDKDISSALALLPKTAIYYFVKASIPRALHQDDLRNKAIAAGLEGDSYISIPDALKTAKVNAQNKDFIYIGGSTFVVADALIALGYK